MSCHNIRKLLDLSLLFSYLPNILNVIQVSAVVKYEGREEKCQGVYSPSDDRTRLPNRIYNVNSLYRLKGRWIHLVDQLLALPSKDHLLGSARSASTTSF